MRPEVGIYLPQVRWEPSELVDRARLVEELGFDSLWIYDHFYEPARPDLPSPEGWTLATWLLSRTERLRIGHLVLCATFRHPALLAYMATTLDGLAGGRFEVGLGSGSAPPEHRQAGLPWGTAAERSERLAEYLEVVTAVWADSPATAGGDHYRITDLSSRSWPGERPRPRLHLGGVGPRATLPLVARYADVWNIPTYGLQVWEERARLLEEECAAIGRDPSTIGRSIQSVLVLAPDDAALAEARTLAERRFAGPGWGVEAGGFVGTPPAVADRMAELQAQGIDTFIFLTHDRVKPETLELLATEVLPRLD